VLHTRKIWVRRNHNVCYGLRYSEQPYRWLNEALTLYLGGYRSSIAPPPCSEYLHCSTDKKPQVISHVCIN